MGTTYYLFRLAAFPAAGSHPEPQQMLPFGPPDKVIQRLLAIPGMSRARWAGPEVDPERDWLVLERDGRHVELCFSHADGIDSLSVDHAAPWDLLEPAAVLEGAGGWAVFDPQCGTWHTLKEFEPQAPVPVHAEVHVTQSGPAHPGAPLAVEWRAVVADSLTPHVFHPTPEALVVVARDRVFALDASTGQLRWAVRCGRPQLFTTATDELLVVGSDQPTVHALDLRTGEERWRLQGRGGMFAAPRALAGGHVALTTEAGQLTVVSADGRVRWRAELSPMIPDTPLPLGEVLLVGGNADRLLLFATETGAVLREGTVSSLLPPSGQDWESSFTFCLEEVGGHAFLGNNQCVVEVLLPELTPGVQLPTLVPSRFQALGGRLALKERELLPPVSQGHSGTWCDRMRVLSLPDLTVNWECTSPLAFPVEVRGVWAVLSTPSRSQSPGPLTLTLVDPCGASLHTLVLGDVDAGTATLAAHGDRVFVGAKGALWCVSIGALSVGGTGAGR
jgi:hypothetical protein